jgi:hypothetical protein
MIIWVQLSLKGTKIQESFVNNILNKNVQFKFLWNVSQNFLILGNVQQDDTTNVQQDDTTNGKHSQF